MTDESNSSVLDHAKVLHRTLRELQHRILVQQPRSAAKASSHHRDLSVAQLSTLTTIRDRGELSLKDLAERTCVSAPSASAMVDKLVEFGLAERRPNATDRREIRISLTPAGEKAAGAFEGESLKSLVDLLDRVGPETARQWRDVYARIQDCLDREKQSGLVVK